MNPVECRNAYTKVFEEKTYRRRLLSLLSRDECAALQDAYLASLPSDACERKHRYRSKGTGLPAYVVCSCGGELWGREDVPELNQAAVLGHTLLHYGAEGGCAACVKTGVIFMFRAWLLSSSEDRELIALSLVAVCECVSRQYLLSTSQNAITQGLAMDCPGPCRQRTLKWCHGMMPNKAFDMLSGVEGGLDSSFRKGLTSLCDSPGVQLPTGYEDLRSYVKGIATFYACSVMTGPGQATGLAAPILRWSMINELQSQFDQEAVGGIYYCSSKPFAPWAGPALNSVLLTRARKDRPVRQTKLPSFEAYLRERLADGFWYAMKAAVSSPDADRLYLTRYSTGIHEYAIDSACAFDTLGHARALQEDALYGACSYDRQPLDQLPDSRPDSYDDIIYAAGYLSLASYVWGANAHLDLLRGQVDQDPATHLPEHWYARVWHDALFGQSAPEELYRWTARTKDHGSFTGDREFTECQSDCSCPERYHKYGLGATLFWARETWCGVSCPSAPFDLWMFGSFVDGVRAILRCGEGKHSPAPERNASAALPVRKACIGGIAQVRCQIIHLLVWCAVDQRSKTPRALAKMPKSRSKFWGFVCKPIGIVKQIVAALNFAKKSVLVS